MSKDKEIAHIHVERHKYVTNATVTTTDGKQYSAQKYGDFFMESQPKDESVAVSRALSKANK